MASRLFVAFLALAFTPLAGALLPSLETRAADPGPAQPATADSGSPMLDEVATRAADLPLWFEPAAPGGDVLLHAGRGPLWVAAGAITFGDPPVTLRLPAASVPVPEQPLASYSNHFRGPPEQWRAGVPHYAAIRFPEVAPGIDILLYATPDGQPEFDALLQPGADLASLRIGIEGAAARVEGGALLLDAGPATHRLEPPYAYQELAGRRVEVPSAFRLHAAEGSFGFDATWRHPLLPLVIDPRIAYGTYLGGSSTDTFRALEVDPQDTDVVYVAGETSSANFPTRGAGSAYQTTVNSAPDMFVAKLDTRVGGASSLLWTTFIGSASSDLLTDIDVDLAGVHLTGYTYVPAGSTDFPTTPNAYQATPYCPASFTCYLPDAFYIQFSRDGKQLLYSTLIGGSDYDFGRGVAGDGTGKATIVGETWAYSGSAFLPTKNANQPLPKTTSYEGFAAQFDAAKSGADSLVFATYVTTGAGTYLTGVDIGADGTSWTVGYGPASGLAASPNAHQPTGAGGTDALVVAIPKGGSPAGAAPWPYASYLGGTLTDQAWAVRVQGDRLLVAGQTSSANFPTTPSVFKGGKTSTDIDGFAAVLDPVSGKLELSTYVGGVGATTGTEVARSIRQASSGEIHVFGWLDLNSALPQLGQPAAWPGGSNDLFAAHFTPDLSSLITSVRVGTVVAETMAGEAATLNARNEPILGTSGSTQYAPLQVASVPGFRKTMSGGTDAWVVRLEKDAPKAACFAPPSIPRGTSATVTSSVQRDYEPIDPNGYQWWFDSAVRNPSNSPPDIAYDRDGDGRQDPDYSDRPTISYPLDARAGERVITVAVRDVSGRPPDTGYATCVTTVVNRAPVAVIHREGSGSIQGKATLTALGPQPSHDPDGAPGSRLQFHWVLPANGACQEVAGVPHEVRCHWTEHGLHEVGLAVVDADGAAGFAVHRVDVQLPRPEAAFDVVGTPRIGCANVPPVLLKDASRPDGTPIRSWAWDIGDDGRVEARTKDHQWSPAAVGAHPIRLTVTDGQGHSHSIVRTIDVERQTGPAAALHRSPPGTVYAGADVMVWDRSVAGDAPLQSLAWDFGDGSVASGATASHRYYAPGRHLLQLTVTDAKGCTNVATDVLHVEALPAPEATTPAPARLEARIDAPAQATVGELVRFADATQPLDGPIVDWRWDIPGAAVPDEARAQARFATAGNHAVALTVVDRDGRRATAVHEVLVTAPPGLVARDAPAPVARAGPDLAATAGSAVRLDGSATSSPGGAHVTFSWIQVDGPLVRLERADTPQPFFLAPESPEPQVLVFRLTVADAAGRSEADDVVVRVEPRAGPRVRAEVAGPVARFHADAQPGEVVEWDFGDGAAGKGQEVSHTYTRSGSYDVVARSASGSTRTTVDILLEGRVRPSETPDAGGASRVAGLPAGGVAAAFAAAAAVAAVALALALRRK
ncbi:MAG TPA: PKD domain-containing protein [Candidatus Thermoplasmatota archaeon]|nr:PKD domain-containing protein [Candidatus Thermoplasmatota archaeon]